MHTEPAATGVGPPEHRSGTHTIGLAHACLIQAVSRARSLSASVTRQATYGTARIGLHTTFSAKLTEYNGGKSIPLIQKFLSSFISGAMASVIGNPFDGTCPPPVGLPPSPATKLKSEARWTLVLGLSAAGQIRWTERAVRLPSAAQCRWCACKPTRASRWRSA